MSAQIVLIIRIIIVVMLYAFLGLMLITLWRITFYSKKTAPEAHAELSLFNISINTSKIFNSPEVYIGRDPNATYQLDDQSASNLHARIYLKKQHWWIEDLNSTNGTIVNYEKISAPTRLFNKDIIQCGSTDLRVEFSNKEEEFPT